MSNLNKKIFKDAKISTILMSLIIISMTGLATFIVAGILIRGNILFTSIEKDTLRIFNQYEQNTRKSLSAAKKMKLQRQADLFASILLDFVLTSDLEAIDIVVKKLMNDIDVVYMEVEDSEGGSLTTITPPAKTENLIFLKSMVKSDMGTEVGSVTIWGDTTKLNKMIEKLGEKSRKLYGVHKASTSKSVRAEFIISTVIIIFLILFTLIPMLIIIRKKVINPIIHEIKPFNLASKTLGEFSQQLTVVGKELAGSVTAQSASTQESVASIEQMRALLEQMAEYAATSQQLGTEIETDTNDGKKVMVELEHSVEALQGVSDQVQMIYTLINNISAKTQIINDIVFKTQLLSFNAAIEAARAGTHGKGFAVVADEIGALATISGEAAFEISKLMDGGLKEVNSIVTSITHSLEASDAVTKQATESFSNITTKIYQIQERISNISRSTKEQFIGMDQNLISIQQLQAAAQENSKIANKTLDNATSIESASNDIKSSVGNLSKLIHGTTANNITKKTQKTS